MDFFKEIGLTTNEGKIYGTIIEFGKLSASEISAKSGVSYSRIYDILDGLVHKGLVKVVPGKSKKYIPADPEVFLKLVNEKEKTLTEARKKIVEMKQFYQQKDKQPVILGYGRKAFYQIVEEMKSTKIYSYSIKWTSEYKPEWVEQRTKKIKQKVDLKELVRYDKETERNVKDWMKINKQMRSIENEGVAFSVVDDEEVLIGLIKANTTLLIRNKEFAKVMKKLFLAAYKEAPEIK